MLFLSYSGFKIATVLVVNNWVFSDFFHELIVSKVFICRIFLVIFPVIFTITKLHFYLKLCGRHLFLNNGKRGRKDFRDTFGNSVACAVAGRDWLQFERCFSYQLLTLLLNMCRIPANLYGVSTKRRPKTEDRRPKTEDRRSKTEDRKTKSSLILGLSNSRQL